MNRDFVSNETQLIIDFADDTRYKYFGVPADRGAYVTQKQNAFKSPLYERGDLEGLVLRTPLSPLSQRGDRSKKQKGDPLDRPYKIKSVLRSRIKCGMTEAG